jgi:hypothetical protein
VPRNGTIIQTIGFSHHSHPFVTPKHNFNQVTFYHLSNLFCSPCLVTSLTEAPIMSYLDIIIVLRLFFLLSFLFRYPHSFPQTIHPS